LQGELEKHFQIERFNESSWEQKPHRRATTLLAPGIL
jgi:hypothetical protein